MKVQDISSQNFKGSVIFIDRYGKVANKTMRDELTKLGANLPKLDEIVSKKSYDLYISEKSMKEHWLLGISTHQEPKNARSYYVAKTLSYYLTEAAQEVMEAFESLAKNVIKN